ncbi:unnamed protein product [Parnassius apollo]|uniref:(apollo) hypothetical protein n=1 Tax=Parnassius apollo TaxID=110799 RepID=A0A8S3YEC0_PARAO|nr:unnamed protein product [Parnassius apollo]
MANTQFALTSKLHEKNICTGLSNLQQNGEFVDMTLAADGHLVKVHQVILALASPYIKDLISSAQCQHPVIFLNKISYTTLAAMLEYIYTGEVLVTVDNLRELLEAGKELHIKGLEDMHLETALTPKNSPRQDTEDGDKIMEGEMYLDTNSGDGEDFGQNIIHKDTYIDYDRDDTIIQESFIEDAMDADETGSINESRIKENTLCQQINQNLQRVGISKVKVANSKKDAEANALQYTVSNQGSLQMILNRYMYYLKYTNRNKSRQWRCVDYINSIRCPAHVVTKDDVVVQRISAHTHPFHDKRILKKLRAGAIFSKIVEAEREGENIIKTRSKNDSNAQSE